MSAPAPVRVETATQLDALEAHAVAWDRLLLAMPRPLVSSSHPYVASYLAHHPDARDGWSVHFAYRDEELVGVLPLLHVPKRVLGLSRPRLCVPCRIHTTYGDALLAAEHARAVFGALLVAAKRVVPRRFSVELGSVRAASPTRRAVPPAGRHGVRYLGEDQHESTLPIAGTLDAYHATLGNNHRRNLRKAKNRLARLPDVRFERFEGEEATPELLERFAEVEASGWKGRRGVALKHAHDRRILVQAEVEGLYARGWLEWHFLVAEGRTVAGHLAVRLGRTLVLRIIGYDESLARLAPGTLLVDHMIERAFAEGRVDRIECMTDMPWHRRWQMDLEPYDDLRIYPWRPLPLLFGALPAHARRALKRLPVVGPRLRRRFGYREDADEES